MRTSWNPGLFAAFEVFFRPYMKSRLSGIYIRGRDNIPKDKVVLILSNHTSWWDGFLLREVHRMFDQDLPYWSIAFQKLVDKYPFLAKIGVKGFDASSLSSMRELASFVVEHSQVTGSWFVLYPQGEIWPATRRPLGFQRGAVWMSSLLPSAATIPVGIHIESLNNQKPSAFISIGAPCATNDETSVRSLEQAVEHELSYIQNMLNAYGERTFEAWKEKHEEIWN